MCKTLKIAEAPSMLSFDDANKNERKYQCFVCGTNHDSQQSMKEHILEKHEEGREYLVCPDCHFPVRHMKFHYTAKHPNRTMPKGLQVRVAVWRDFKSNGDKKKTRKPTFRSGSFLSNKNGGVEVPYRSGMECEFLECLESDKDVVGYIAEPFRVPYFWNGQWHEYIPDLRVQFVDNTVEIWEIKPANQTQLEQNQAKWSAMHNHALNQGWEFIVQTEVGLGKLKNKVKRQQNLITE